MNEATEIYNALLDSVKLTRTWHGMGYDVRVEERMWNIYCEKSPEMKKLNAVIDKYKHLTKPATGSGK